MCCVCANDVHGDNYIKINKTTNNIQQIILYITIMMLCFDGHVLCLRSSRSKTRAAPASDVSSSRFHC
jgi:hypothetical protein